jgi:hypothetical protein
VNSARTDIKDESGSPAISETLEAGDGSMFCHLHPPHCVTPVFRLSLVIQNTVNLATIVSLIASSRSRSGLRVRAELDRTRYPGGVTVTDKQMAQIRLEPHDFHGEWNYTICPATNRLETWPKGLPQPGHFRGET